VTMQKWGGLACFLMAAAFLVAPLIYLVGNLRDAMGPFAYSIADFLYGPLWGASLVMALPGVGAGAARIGRLDNPPPSPCAERAFLGGRRRVTARVPAPRSRTDRRGTGYRMGVLAGALAVEKRVGKNAIARGS
jgi:hypothetical protein